MAGARGWRAHFAELPTLAIAASVFRRAAGLVFGAVRSGRPRRLLGPTVGMAVVLAFSALAVWGAALWFSWGGECPGSSAQSGSLDKGISVWPPAAECVDQQGNSFWHEALPWATWVAAMLVAAAAVILLTGLVVAIRDLRRPAPAVSPHVALLEASFADDRRGGPSRPREEAARAEREPPAIAA
jgi:hypothetical protein